MRFSFATLSFLSVILLLPNTDAFSIGSSDSLAIPGRTTSVLSAADSPDDLDSSSSGRRSFLQKGSLGGAAAAASVFVAPPLKHPPIASASDEPATKKNIKDVKVALWGFGNQNKLMAKYLHERGIPIVAVVARHDIGKDYTQVDLDPWGNKIGGKKSGVKLVDEAAAKVTLAATKPDVCLMCTRSTLEDLAPSLTVCAQAKTNVITIAEELLDCRTSSLALTKQIDSLFQSNGVTLTGSGFIDGACCEMALALSSMMHKVTGMSGSLQYNVDDYGLVLAQAHGVGLTPNEFQKEIVESPQAKSYVYNSNEWFVSALGLTLKETKERREPTFASVPLYSASLGRDIPAGDCTGMKVIATTTTKEGVTITGQQIGKCYEKSDFDETTWGFQGEPEGVQFSMANCPTPQMTNTATISRILQILEAPAGYVTSDRLPIARYEHWL